MPRAMRHLWDNRSAGNYILFIAFLTLFFVQCGQPPMPDQIKLRGKWFFKYDPDAVGIQQHWYADSTNFQSWETVPSNGYWDKNYDGWGWYSQQVFIPALQSKQKLALVITSVDDQAKVWLNDSLVASQTKHGELFYTEITNIYNPNAKNRITIMVDDIGGPGGLNGEVYLRKYLNEVDLLKGKYYDAESIKSPEWVHNAILYEIFVRSFSRDGDFAGVQSRLAYLQDLGVNTLWLMPIHPTGEKNRKGSYGSPYAVKDYYEVNPKFGTKADFRNLVDAAHQKGMHLILDMVLNHSAWDNPLIKKHPEWYTHNDSGKIISPNSDWTDVADFNYDNKALRKYMIDMLKYWVQDFGVDGFRFDVAGLVPLDFWVEARKELQQVDPDIFFLAEDSQPVMHVSAFDATYSWNLYWGLMSIFQKDTSATVIQKVMQREEYKYPKHAIRMRFTENHDEQRAAKMLTKPQAFAGAVFVNTIPGIPLLYNGQEIGAKVKPTLFDRDVIQWQQGDQDYFDLYKTLFALRKSHQVIVDGNFEFKPATPKNAVVAFTRSNQDETLLIVVNFKSESHKTEITFGTQVQLKDPVQTSGIALNPGDNQTEIRGTLQPYGWGIYSISLNEQE